MSHILPRKALSSRRNWLCAGCVAGAAGGGGAGHRLGCAPSGIWLRRQWLVVWWLCRLVVCWFEGKLVVSQVATVPIGSGPGCVKKNARQIRKFCCAASAQPVSRRNSLVVSWLRALITNHVTKFFRAVKDNNNNNNNNNNNDNNNSNNNNNNSN